MPLTRCPVEKLWNANFSASVFRFGATLFPELSPPHLADNRLRFKRLRGHDSQDCARFPCNSGENAKTRFAQAWGILFPNSH